MVGAAVVTRADGEGAVTDGESGMPAPPLLPLLPMDRSLKWCEMCSAVMGEGAWRVAFLR